MQVFALQLEFNTLYLLAAIAHVSFTGRFASWILSQKSVTQITDNPLATYFFHTRSLVVVVLEWTDALTKALCYTQ